MSSEKHFTDVSVPTITSTYFCGGDVQHNYTEKYQNYVKDTTEILFKNVPCCDGNSYYPAHGMRNRFYNNWTLVTSFKDEKGVEIPTDYSVFKLNNNFALSLCVDPTKNPLLNNPNETPDRDSIKNII